MIKYRIVSTIGLEMKRLNRNSMDLSVALSLEFGARLFLSDGVVNENFFTVCSPKITGEVSFPWMY